MKRKRIINVRKHKRKLRSGNATIVKRHKRRKPLHATPREDYFEEKKNIDLAEIANVLEEIQIIKQLPDEYISEINELFEAYEMNREGTISEVSLPAWKVIKYKNTAFLLSPPVAYRGVAVRMGLDINNPFAGTHVNVRVFPCEDDFEPIEDISYSACITTNKLGKSLISTFALWDFISRISIPSARKAGIITDGWISNIFREGIKRCSRVYIGHLNERYVNINEELDELETLLNTRGIHEESLEGEGKTDNGGRYYNSWFEGNVCTACGTSVRTPSKAWPWPQYKHIKTMKHRRNAAKYLLKMQAG